MSEREKKGGYLTESQQYVLKLRFEGYFQEEIAKKLGTTRQNVSLIERRARENVKKAERTLMAYRRLQTVAEVKLNPDTHLVDVPRKLIDAADLVGVKINVDFVLVYKMIRDQASESVSGTQVIKPILLRLLNNGDVYVERVS